jgi:hypothetical protein
MKKLKALLLLILLLVTAYSGAWLYMEYVLNQKITQLYNDAPSLGINLYGDYPRVTGFPFEPKITYLKGLEKDGVSITFDKLTIEGFPIPSFPLLLSLPKGVEIQDQKNKTTIAMDYVDLELITPKSLPQSDSKMDIEQWQKEIEKIDITRSKITNENFTLNSKGSIGLDNDLQVSMMLSTNIYGYKNIIKSLISTNTIKPFVGALALSGMNSMAQTNPQNGEKFVDLDFIIKNRQMFIGPIRVTKLPAIHWQ